MCSGDEVENNGGVELSGCLRGLCRGAGVGGWLLLCALSFRAQADDDPKPILLQLQWQPQAQFGGYMVAEKKGFFGEAGVPNARLRWWVEGDSPFRLTGDGKVDFCTGWLSQGIAERAKGNPLVNIAQIMQESALMLVTRRASGITKPEDMTDRRVGLWGVDFDVQPTAFFKKFGARPKIVLQSASMSPFLRGAVDIASAMYYNEYHKLIEAGMRPEELRTFRFSDFGMNFPEDGIYCTEATRADRPKICAAVASASIRGWAYAFEHEAEALDIIMAYCNEARLPTNRNHQRWMLRAMAEMIRCRVGADPAQWGTLAPDDYRNVAEILREQGLIHSIPPYEEFYKPALPGKGASP